jgi:hypothetical protein
VNTISTPTTGHRPRGAALGGRGIPPPRPRFPTTVGNDPGNSIRLRIA